MNLRNRLLTLGLAALLLGTVATVVVLRAAARDARHTRAQAGGPQFGSGTVSLAASTGRRMVFRNMAWGPHLDQLVSVPAADPTGTRTASDVLCLRFYAAAGTGICLQKRTGTLQESYRAAALDASLRTERTFPLAGIPTRARVSPSGHLVAWTVFVGGDSYAGGTFSTRTSLLDTRDWSLTPSLESYRIIKDGHDYHATDINFWGVTFADDDHFYATLGTGGKTYLVHGDIAARTLTTVLENVECPSLSPDGTRIAFKKRVPGLPVDAPWHEYVLDLRTLKETALAEPRSVDDQAVWSGPDSVVYELPGNYGADLWTVPADGTGHPQRLMLSALAPAYIG